MSEWCLELGETWYRYVTHCECGEEIALNSGSETACECGRILKLKSGRGILAEAKIQVRKVWETKTPVQHS